MRLPLCLTAGVLLARAALADCPPDCLPGGGPKTTDCYLQWGGIPSMTPPPCADGSACDADATADGACTFPVQACLGVATSDGCTLGPISAAPTVKPPGDAVGQALAAALTAVGASGCTPSGLRVPLKVSLKGIKPGKVRLKVTATAGGKKDADTLKLTCVPSASGPSFSADVQPILSGKCALCGCHAGTPPTSPPSLEPGKAFAAIVGQPAPLTPRKKLVQPRVVKKSYLAAKILGQKITGLRMPNGCPNLAPLGGCPSGAEGGCLDDAQLYTVLGWIQSGAANN